MSNFKAFNRINIIKNLELSIQNFQISCLIKLQNPEEGTFFGLKKEELANNINIFKEEFNIYYQKCDFCKGNLQSNACI